MEAHGWAEFLAKLVDGVESNIDMAGENECTEDVVAMVRFLRNREDALLDYKVIIRERKTHLELPPPHS